MHRLSSVLRHLGLYPPPSSPHLTSSSSNESQSSSTRVSVSPDESPTETWSKALLSSLYKYGNEFLSDMRPSGREVLDVTTSSSLEASSLAQSKNLTWEVTQKTSISDWLFSSRTWLMEIVRETLDDLRPGESTQTTDPDDYVVERWKASHRERLSLGIGAIPPTAIHIGLLFVEATTTSIRALCTVLLGVVGLIRYKADRMSPRLQYAAFLLGVDWARRTNAFTLRIQEYADRWLSAISVNRNQNQPSELSASDLQFSSHVVESVPLRHFPSLALASLIRLLEKIANQIQERIYSLRRHRFEPWISIGQAWMIAAFRILRGGIRALVLFYPWILSKIGKRLLPPVLLRHQDAWIRVLGRSWEELQNLGLYFIGRLLESEFFDILLSS